MKGYITVEAGCVASKTQRPPLVSVIVPIYNTEKYLDQALNSIETQTLNNIEILCVNDGSTDGSREILQAHADADDRIRVIDKPNGGYGSACNRGLKEARGTWIAIVEPDDWIEPGMYKDMTAYAAQFSEPIDIVKAPFFNVLDPDTPHERRLKCGYYTLLKPTQQPFTIEDPGFTLVLSSHPSIWSALYRREFLENNNITFHEIPGAGWADNPFMMETYCKAKTIVYLKQCYYNYRTETYEEAAQFTRKNPLLPMERWNDMTDILDASGIQNREVRRQHNSRGFIYLGGVVEQRDFSHQDVYDAALGMFNRMEDDLVFSDPETPPSWKVQYALMKGVELPPISSFGYRKALFTKGFRSLINVGPSNTWIMVERYFRKRKKWKQGSDS